MKDYNGLFQRIMIQEDGCKLLSVQCSLEKLANSPNVPSKKVQKNAFGLELSASVSL